MDKFENFLIEQMRLHIGICFDAEALDYFNNCQLIFTTMNEIKSVDGPCIAILTEEKNDIVPDKIEHVKINEVDFTLLNIIKGPGPDWVEHKVDGITIWYESIDNKIIPAWNHFQIIYDLFSFRAERENTTRDRHKRLKSVDNPYLSAGLGGTPIFNEFVYLLLMCIKGSQNKSCLFSDITDWVSPLKFVLSHDCDVLLGHNKFSQIGRTYQMIRGIAHFNFHASTYPLWMFVNLLNPRKFYMNNIYAMIDLERQFGFTSILYILNGSGGRFGFRNNLSAVEELVSNIPEHWEIGLHYNYDTYLNPEKFGQQKRELEKILGYQVSSGRAHYLKFDPLVSFQQLEDHSINFDESLGISDSNGFRLGLAGVFFPFLFKEKRVANVLCLPLQYWDSHLNTEGKLVEFEKSLVHLSKIGGVMSMLFHPGQFYNWETPEMDGTYFRVLKAFKSVNARSVTTKFLVEKAELLSLQ